MEEENKQPIETPAEAEIKSKDEKKLHDRTCPRCKQPIKIKIGKDNWKNLFKKPTVDDWITLVILILLMMAAFAYTQETATCKAMTKNIGQTCMQYYNWINNQNNTPLTASLSLLNYTSPTNSVDSTNDSCVGDACNLGINPDLVNISSSENGSIGTFAMPHNDSNSSGSLIGGENSSSIVSASNHS